MGANSCDKHFYLMPDGKCTCVNIAELRKAATAVFLVTDAPVAGEISKMLSEAADEIQYLRSLLN
jgi:hypothetical protein